MDYLAIRGACVVLAIVSLAPLALYLVGRVRDPFHPLALAGLLAFGIADFKLLLDPGSALNYVEAGSLVEFELIAAASLLCLYLGWHWRGWRRPAGRLRGAVAGSPPRAYSPSRLLGTGGLMALLALTAWLVDIHRVRATGYVADWVFLQTPAAVLLIQAGLLDRNLWLPALTALCLDLFGCAYHAYTYGSRSTTAILFTVLAVPFFVRGARPRKKWVLVAGAVGFIVMMTLAETRTIVGKGEAPNRFAALWVAGERFIHGGQRRYGAGREFVVGAGEVQVVQDQQNWNFGRVFPDMAIIFLPHQYFPDKYDWVSPWDAPHFFPLLRRYLGLTKKVLSYGVAPTGFADAYVNFWWMFPLFWLALGYFLNFIYAEAVYGHRLDHQCYLVCSFLVLFLLVGQDIEAGEFAALFTMLPAWLAYGYAAEHNPHPGLALHADSQGLGRRYGSRTAEISSDRPPSGGRQ